MQTATESGNWGHGLGASSSLYLSTAALLNQKAPLSLLITAQLRHFDFDVLISVSSTRNYPFLYDIFRRVHCSTLPVFSPQHPFCLLLPLH